MKTINDQKISTTSHVVGIGANFKGEFEFDGMLRVDGTISGKIKTNGLVHIGEKGVANCNIFANEIKIHGKVKGNLYALKKIIISSTGEVTGNIIAPNVSIEYQAFICGHCFIDKTRVTEKEFTDHEILNKDLLVSIPYIFNKNSYFYPQTAKVYSEKAENLGEGVMNDMDQSSRIREEDTQSINGASDTKQERKKRRLNLLKI